MLVEELDFLLLSLTVEDFLASGSVPMELGAWLWAFHEAGLNITREWLLLLAAQPQSKELLHVRTRKLVFRTWESLPSELRGKLGPCGYQYGASDFVRRTLYQKYAQALPFEPGPQPLLAFQNAWHHSNVLMRYPDFYAAKRLMACAIGAVGYDQARLLFDEVISAHSQG